MPNDVHPAPRQYLGVMVSSTFTDLEQHRAVLIQAIKANGPTDVAMENDAAKPDLDVIDSSLQMVRDASAYFGVIGSKYGQTPTCPKRNPGKLSITELEFNEAQRLGRPILLFVMGDMHPVLAADVETNATKKRKLKAFRERSKQMKPDSAVERVYDPFDSLEEFTAKANQAVAGLRRYLYQIAAPASQPGSTTSTLTPTTAAPDPIPKPPAFYAEPPYIGSHKFVGRQAQLDVLNDWAAAADPHPVLLFEAIGGSGKSMLTWHWTKEFSTQTRTDWAGRFWYSFYERGAIMADFCQHALAYITGRPLEYFRKMKTPELVGPLLHHLQDRPWLVILDGLERVLVAYHRYDAAQLPDEEASQPTDQIAKRDPCAAIRPEDDDLLRTLAAATPSKLLITSRLVPRVLLNQASQAIPGVLRVSLPGLRPADAETLLRSCGVTGASTAIQDYLKSHCDCHPLGTGVLAGLINNYLPNRGNFDDWAADPAGGGQLNLANLDLVQKRNHILKAALDAIPEKSRQLLSTLALLSEAVDYFTLSALNPHLPPEPEKVVEPLGLEKSPRWKTMSDAATPRSLHEFQAAFDHRKEYERALKARLESPEFLAAPQELANTIHDLERRGLLQYDGQSKRYDLHPVVRGIAAGGLRKIDKERYGQRVVDHFSQQTHIAYKEAESFEDVRTGLHVVRTLIQMGHYQQAVNLYAGALDRALYFNLEAHAEVLSLLRPLFPKGWATLPTEIPQFIGSYLTHQAGLALDALGEITHAIPAFETALLGWIRSRDWENAVIDLNEIARTHKNRALKERCLKGALEFGVLAEEHYGLFSSRLEWYYYLCRLGRWNEAENTWCILEATKDEISDDRPGYLHFIRAQALLWQGGLNEGYLSDAEARARKGRIRWVVYAVHKLRGEWRLAEGQWALAADSLHEAVRMAREVGRPEPEAEAQLALAKFHLDQLDNPRHEAEQLAQVREPSHLNLAELWLAIGDAERAKKHALEACKSAWGDGEPYVFRYELDKARALLEKLGAEIPKLPPYDPAKDPKLAWEDEVTAAIEELRAAKVAKSGKQD